MSALSYYWDERGGWVRFFNRGLSIASPLDKPLFSERNGYRKPFLKFRGWRVFWLSGVSK